MYKHIHIQCTCTCIYVYRAQNLYPAIGHFLVISPLCPGKIAGQIV